MDKVKIGHSYPSYFIADIAANHDGNLQRAQELIFLAAEAGANAAKFQHFSAETIVSDHGFKSLGGAKSHQSQWKKSVFEVYKDASVDLEWTIELKKTCDKAKLAFMTSPYSFDLVDHVDAHVAAYKIGSGDISWTKIIEYIAAKNKPYILATGASMLSDVQRAVTCALKVNPNLCLMQCNTNYTGSLENFKYIQLNVLKTFQSMYPQLVLGLSDHTPGHSTVLGAVALGARMIEKHFTDDTTRVGPDHAFSMDFKGWREMVYRTRELENALGGFEKKVEDNERETVVLQRRAVRACVDLPAGTLITSEHLVVLRPCPETGIPPYEMASLFGKRLKRSLCRGEYVQWKDCE
ncbi:MAG: N-acetylneuraminate synthase family protein [Deltaproteobacteria bacterium]|nr:N-acetylneuraminate synthase family protein [Deltaproteobacteria bacterium]